MFRNKHYAAFIILPILYCTLLPNISLAQSLPFTHYSVKDGLVSAGVTGIFQDSGGFLWVATQHGLSRFNGVNFENMSIKDGLVGDYITDICEDGDGNIWVVSKAGAGYFRSGNFKSYKTEEYLKGKNILSVAADKDGKVWFGTDEGIITYNGNDYRTYTKKDGLVNEHITAVAADNDGKMWFGSQRGLYCFNKNRFIIYTASGDKSSFNDAVEALEVDKKGNLWVGTRGGLFRYRDGSFIPYPKKKRGADLSVKAIEVDRNGNLWIGTENGAEYFADGTFTNYNTKHGLPNDRILSVFEDREGNIWFGTSMGLSRLHSLRFLNFSTKHGLPNNLIWAILQDRRGHYWFGTDKGLSRYAGGTFKNFTSENGLVDNAVYVLQEDRKGNIWIGTFGGISVYSPGTGGFRNYTMANGLPQNITIALEIGRQGTVWIGTTKGLCRFVGRRIESPGFTHKPTPIHTIMEDGKGNLWFSDNDALCKVIPGTDAPVRYTVADGLIYDGIYMINEDRTGRIWIATAQGLSCFSNGQFTNYTTADGLSDNVCYFVLDDDDGNIWIGTGHGVNRFDGKTFKVYTPRDGPASYEMSEKACLKDRDGNLWFGMVNGVTRFNPKLDRFNTVPPAVYVTAFEVLEREHPMSADIRLKHNQNYVNIGFTGISFTSPEDVLYRYQLIGIDGHRFETKSRNVSYPYLPSGDYRFQVFAVNNDGIESARPAEFRFRVLPPFWATWWFITLSVFAVLAAILMFVLWRIKRVKERIAQRERNKQLVMAQKMELLGILAGGAVHDLKNLLSIIIGYSKIAAQHAHLRDHEEEMIKPIDNIKTTAGTAIQVVKQMLAFTRGKHNETVTANLADLLDDILEILKVTTPAEINIRWERPEQDVCLAINPTRFQQVVMNLCLNSVHAIEESGEYGELDIRLYEEEAYSGKRVILEIADTGCGMDEDVLEKIYDPLFTTKEPGKGTGLGLFVVKQVADECGWEIEARSKRMEGTVFKITFPPGNQ
jgi:ligand-binding sensor domain-containing protein/signal transduction histidine kinase